MIQHYIRDWETPGSLLGPNFLRCFSNQLSKSDRHLHGIAVKTMKAILIVVDNHAKDNNRSCGILTSVIGSHYHVDFDKVTRTKFIEKVLAKADSSDQDSAVNMLSKAIITVPSDLDRPVAQWRIASADFLLITAKNQKTPKEQITKSKDCQKIVMKKIIRLFTYMAYCKVTLDTDHHQEYTPEIDQQTRDVFRSRLLSALSHLMTQTDDPSEMPALAANILLETDKNVQTPPISESEKSIFEDIQRAGRHMNQCEEKATSIPQSAADSSDNQKLYRAFRLLFALSIIQAFSGDADALNVLAELELACAKIKNDEMEYGFDAIVEVILSLIAKPSVLFRRVGKEVFSSCANFMNVDALDPMFEVLQKSENLSGQQELFDAEEANSDGEEEIESDSDSSTSTSQAGEDVEEDDEELLEFESKLAQALGTQRAEIELVDDGGEDSDGDMMDDEQMAALDPVMSNIFKQRKQTSSKKDNKNAKETIVQFKTKVLELLEIYIQQTAQGVSPENSATILLKCLDCIQRTKNKQVSERAAAVIKTALNVYKLSMESPRNKRILRRVGDALTEIHEIILLPGSNVYLRACSQASLFCVKVILNNGGAMEKVWRQYSLTGESMAVSQDIKVVNVLFQDWFNWLITAKITLSNRSKS